MRHVFHKGEVAAERRAAEVERPERREVREVGKVTGEMVAPSEVEAHELDEIGQGRDVAV